MYFCKGCVPDLSECFIFVGFDSYDLTSVHFLILFCFFFLLQCNLKFLLQCNLKYNRWQLSKTGLNQIRPELQLCSLSSLFQINTSMLSIEYTSYQHKHVPCMLNSLKDKKSKRGMKGLVGLGTANCKCYARCECNIECDTTYVGSWQFCVSVDLI